MVEVAEKQVKKGKYIQTIGRRKSAIAQVRLFVGGKGEIIVNEKDYKKYFPTETLRQMVISPLVAVGQEAGLDVTVKVSGGGHLGQANSVRMGIARALIEMDENLRPTLKKLGFLHRDARIKERKKPGLKKARKKTQWSKR